MGQQLGLDATLYYKTTGVSGGGGWVEAGNVRDLQIGGSKGEADITTRAAAGYRSTLATLKEITLTFEVLKDNSDPFFTALFDAFTNNTHIGFRALDADGKGPQGDFHITEFTEDQPLEEAIKVSVTAKLTYVDTALTWL